MVAIASPRSKQMTAKEADDLSKTSLREMLSASHRAAAPVPAVAESHDEHAKDDERDDWVEDTST